MKDYCSKCNNMVDIGVKKKIEKFNVKGSPIEQENDVVYCLNCGEEIFNEEYDSKNLERAYDEYRRKNDLLTSEEIKSIRKKYNLSQKDFARILGFGEVTITRYENGTIQDKANDNLIRMAEKTETFLSLVKNSNLLNHEKEHLINKYGLYIQFPETDKEINDSTSFYFKENIDIKIDTSLISVIDYKYGNENATSYGYETCLNDKRSFEDCNLCSEAA